MDYEVIVAGGGPAGSTVAGLLAKAGRTVLVLEKDAFPRFHIGESLLPCGMSVFDRLGFEPSRADYVRKEGAEFINERNDRWAVFPFEGGLEGTAGYAWQVERAQFDHDLLRNAERLGATVHEEEKVTDWSFFEDRVEIETDTARYAGRYFVDATGQDALLARRNKSVDPIKGFGMGAVFCHFAGIKDEVEQELLATGNIKVLLIEDGWIWVIPLKGKKISVGVVKRTKGVSAELLEEELKQSPLLQRLSEGASRTEPRIIRNFSYVNRQSFGPRWACIGDAACFLDPVFSSGVSLALLSGEYMADLLCKALPEGSEDAPDLAAQLKEHMFHGYRCFGSTIRSFYDSNLVENLFFYDTPDPTAKKGFTSILAGDVWRDDNRFQDALINGRRGWNP